MPDFKKFFETPQKARTTVTCLAVAAATFIAVIVYIVYAVANYGPWADAPVSPSEAVSAPAESTLPTDSAAPEETADPTQAAMGLVPTLTMEEAKELALADAGAVEEEADISREALSQDNGIWVYEFRFRTQQAQYEYKLNANTGEIRTKVKETFVYPSPEVTDPVMPSLPADSAPPVETAPQVSNPVMPMPSATQPPASPAPTPAPTSTPLPTQSGTMYIGMDRAKAIALEHAGLSASQVFFTEAHMDREDGRMVYEMEFRQGQVEYEYEIDASTGRILDYEKDWD